MNAATLARAQEFAGYLNSGFTGNVALPGWSLKGACAVGGNSVQENLARPVTTGVKDHGSDGELQWRLERLTDMQGWCTKYFGDWRTIKAQAAFTLYETARDYKELDAELRAGTKTIATMATNFNRVFERSADNEAINQRRIDAANQIYASFAHLPEHQNAKTPPIGATATVGAGGAFLAALWTYAGAHLDIALGLSLLGNGLLGAWAIYSLTRSRPVPNGPAPHVVPGSLDQFRAAKEALAAAQQLFDNARKSIQDQIAAESAEIQQAQTELKL